MKSIVPPFLRATRWKQFIKNIVWLFKNNLDKKIHAKQPPCDMFDGYKYEILAASKNTKLPKIKNADETIAKIYSAKASICRFGDGEFALIDGQSIPFQTATEELSQKLLTVLTSNNKKILIGIGYFYYYPREFTFDYLRVFLRHYMAAQSKNLEMLIDFDKQYYDTFVSQMYTTCESYDFKRYFEKIKILWRNRDITVICGESVFKNITHNIFECAKSIQYMYAPCINAFSYYDTILYQARKILKNRLIVIILGPTATILAYDLTLEGYQALDFGHIAKDYDCYKKKVVRSSQQAINFFKPD